MTALLRLRVDSRAALLAGLAVDNFGSGLFLPLGILYATQVVGLDVGVAGGVIAAATALGFAVPPLAARITHLRGPRFVVVLSQILQGLGALVFLFASGATSVFVAAGLLSMGVQAFYCSVFILIADASGSEAKERPFALVGMVRAGAFGLGTLAAAVVLVQVGDDALRLLVALDALTFAVAALIVATAAPVQSPVREPTHVSPVVVLRDGRYVTLMISVALLALTVDFALVGTPVFIVDVIEGPIWLPGTLLAVGTAIASVYGVRVVDALRTYPRTRSLQVSALLFAAFALFFMLLIWIPSAWVVIYGLMTWLLFVAGIKIFFPISGALSEALPPRAARAGYMATYQYSFLTAQVLAPAVVALFAVTAWLPWALVAGAAVVGGGALGRLSGITPTAMNLPSHGRPYG